MEVRFTCSLFVLLFAWCVLVSNKSYGQFRYSKTSAIEIVRSPETDDSLKNDKKDSSGFKQKLTRINAVMEDVVKYSPLPIISYSTETDWMFGLTKYNGFRLGSKGVNDTTIQPSHVTALAYLTLNHQYKIGTEVDLMFKHNKYKSHSEVYYLNFPQFYYGTGNETKLADERLVLAENLTISTGFEYNFTSSLYVGLYYHFNNYYTVDYDDTLLVDYQPDLTVNEGLQSGIGLNFARETRDNRFNASKGSYLFVKYMNYGKWIGSDFNYNLFIIDYRKYVKLFRFLTVAGQIYTESRTGDVPVQSLALMGGDNRMRGIYIGRYRDHTLIDGQVELRFPIAWIFGGTVFGGLGEVSPDYGSYTWNGIHWSGGAGIRLMVDSRHKTNLRFDVGFSQNRQLYFFTFSEAF